MRQLTRDIQTAAGAMATSTVAVAGSTAPSRRPLITDQHGTEAAAPSGSGESVHKNADEPAAPSPSAAGGGKEPPIDEMPPVPGVFPDPENPERPDGPETSKPIADYLDPEADPELASIMQIYKEQAWLRTDNMTASTTISGKDTAQCPEQLRTDGALYVGHYLDNPSEEHYKKFTAGQHDEQTRLKLTTYAELAEFRDDAVGEPSGQRVIQYIDQVHDIFKNNDLMTEVGLIPGQDSHDEGMRRLFSPEHAETLKRVLPTYAAEGIFTADEKEQIREVLTARFNLARFMEGQCSPSEISSIDDMNIDTLKLVIQHGIDDIGGALGHKNNDPTTSLTIDELTARRMMDAKSALLDPPETFGLPSDIAMTPIVREMVFFHLRAARLGLDMHASSLMEQSAIISQLQIANLFRVDTPEAFAPLQAAYRRLPEVLAFAMRANHNHLLYGPDWSEGTEQAGLDYAAAFLRSITTGGNPDKLYQVLGYFSQIIVKSASMNIEASVGLRDKPHDNLNLHPLALWLARTNPAQNQKIPIAYVQEGSSLVPTPVMPGDNYPRNIILDLVDPDTFKPR